MNALLVVVVLVVSLIPLPARERYHVPIARADDRALAYQLPYVDIDVAENDFGPGRNSLHLVAVTAVPGQQAEIIDETTVRIHIDWAGYLAYPAAYDPVMGRVAYGTYTVSNGYARSQARWTVWYVPDMRV